MIRATLRSYSSIADCIAAIDNLSSRFTKEHQRKPVVDLLASTTFSSGPDTSPRRREELNKAVYSIKEAAKPSSIHELTLMVTDKVQRETEATKLAAEVDWFKAQAVVGGVS